MKLEELIKKLKELQKECGKDVEVWIWHGFDAGLPYSSVKDVTYNFAYSDSDGNYCTVITII